MHRRVSNRVPIPSLPQRQRAGRQSLGPQLPGYVRILSLWVFIFAVHSKSESSVTAGVWSPCPQVQHAYGASGNRAEFVWQPGPLTRHCRLFFYPKMGCWLPTRIVRFWVLCSKSATASKSYGHFPGRFPSTLLFCTQIALVRSHMWEIKAHFPNMTNYSRLTSMPSCLGPT